MAFDRFTQLALPDFIAETGDPNALWLFVHIPKTAGSSLANEIARLRKPYRNIHIDYTSRDVPHEQQLQHAVDQFIDDARTTPFRSASGHLTIEHAREIGAAIPGTKLVTFLREPAARVVSDYRYARTPKHPPFKEFIAEFPSIEDYIHDPASQNKMAKHLGSGDPSTVFAEFDFIGALELYPLSFNIFFSMMGKNILPQLHERKTESNADNTVDLTPQVLAEILVNNQEDVRIFEATREALRARRDDWRRLRRA